MTDAEILQDILNPAIFVEHESDYTSYKYVRLCEAKAKDSIVTIKQLPEDIIILKIDEFQFTRKLDKSNTRLTNEEYAKQCSVFRGNHDENCTADYIIISPSERTVIFAEMKSSKCNGIHIIKQLHGAQCFFECMKLFVSHFIPDEKQFLSSYSNGFVKFMYTNSKYYAKDTSRRTRTTCAKTNDVAHNTPETACVIKNNEISYAKLHYKVFNKKT